jgi:tetratricopeptide (TPR) repeat protein
MQDVENLFLEVSKAIDERDISTAKELLEEILSIDPGYGRAHNHLGWIYETKIKDFDRAKRHYELAIKFCQGTYPVVYVNFGYLLIEYNDYEKAIETINEGLRIRGADRATLQYQKGKIAEHEQDFKSALAQYEIARKLSFNKEFHSMLENEIARVKSKLSFWDKFLILVKNF